MKTIITLSALALMSNLAIAENFTHEQQIASPDLSNQDFSSTGTQGSTTDVRVSLDSWNRGNPDVAHVPYNHVGMEMKSEGRWTTSYDALNQSNPDLAS